MNGEPKDALMALELSCTTREVFGFHAANLEDAPGYLTKVTL